MVFKPALANSGLKSTVISVKIGTASLNLNSIKSLGDSSMILSTTFKAATLDCHLAEDFKYANSSTKRTEDKASTGRAP
ncbi:hypothetical protein WICPIJ_003155 [Wickerhamomyces pijperi]|uniref:Uncharacterized protein n=1 Tax=Wickerhamomyces pijperi TaxID=599730 RepID=A0A9P8Q8C3_WICPI|nr:hypothetical protein WICPIJ_003155 [Wickerhamomyces pijperi]